MTENDAPKMRFSKWLALAKFLEEQASKPEQASRARLDRVTKLDESIKDLDGHRFQSFGCFRFPRNGTNFKVMEARQKLLEDWYNKWTAFASTGCFGNMDYINKENIMNLKHFRSDDDTFLSSLIEFLKKQN